MKRFRFRFFTLFCFVAVCCIPLGIWANSAYHQSQLRLRLWKELQGTVGYDGSSGTCCGSAPNWLTTLVGDDFFCSVVTIHLHRANLTTEDIKLLKQFRYLERVHFIDVEPTENDLKLMNDLLPANRVENWRLSPAIDSARRGSGPHILSHEVAALSTPGWSAAQAWLRG